MIKIITFDCGCEYETGGRQLRLGPECNVRNHILPDSMEGIIKRLENIEKQTGVPKWYSERKY